MSKYIMYVTVALFLATLIIMCITVIIISSDLSRWEELMDLKEKEVKEKEENDNK